MMARILDGKALAARLRADVKAKLAQRAAQPGLAVILAGDDPASRVYVRNKLRACEETGIRTQLFEFPSSVCETQLCRRIEELNDDIDVHAILVQLPLPRHIETHRVLNRVLPTKDVDGFHDKNLGALAAGKPGLVPCTPAGIMRLLAQAGVPIAGHHAVVIGRSTIVGKPLALLLLGEDATVTVCHSKSRDLASFAKDADILVAAAGRPKLVRAEMVKPGACVVDVGINRLPDGTLAGDVDFAAVRRVAGWITPVPGGVGPMTIAMLLENCLQAATKNESAA